MHRSVHIKGYQMDISITKRTKVKGVNSRLADGNHFLMWDFDKVPLGIVSLELGLIQEEWQLPDIHILQSSYPGHYHAYCFHRLPWAKLSYILWLTRGVDPQFIKLGTFRGYMTLRFSDKPNTHIAPVGVLLSTVLPTVQPTEATSFESYYAKVRT